MTGIQMLGLFKKWSGIQTPFSSLHWPIKDLFCVFLVQWSMFPLGCSEVMYLDLCPKMHLCAKRASKTIVPPEEMLLSFSIGTFFD